MQGTRYVGWRNDDGERLTIAAHFGIKAARSFPLLVNGGRCRLEIKAIGDLGRRGIVGDAVSLVGFIKSNAGMQGTYGPQLADHEVPDCNV